MLAWHRIMKIWRGAFPRHHVIYGKSFFAEAWFENWNTLKHILLELLLSVSEWKSILNFWCGPGMMINIMNERNIDYIGFDKSLEAQKLYMQHFGKFTEKYIIDYECINNSRYDVVTSFDVLEHMEDIEIERLLNSFHYVNDMFAYISRARRIEGHINIKSDKGWINFFQKHGRTFNKSLTEALREKYKKLRPHCEAGWNSNMFVFSK